MAEKIVYSAFDKIAAEKQGTNPLEVLERAVNNARPRLEVKSRRVGGATYQVPLEISGSRQIALALRWLVNFSHARKGVLMKDALASEIREASEGQGSCIRKRETRCTKWPSQTRHSRTSAGSILIAWPSAWPSENSAFVYLRALCSLK